MSFRLTLGSFGLLLTGLYGARALAAAPAVNWPNPLVKQRADPQVLLAADGWYYLTATVPEYNRIELRRAHTIAELPLAEPKAIWSKHATGTMAANIWAPEIHFIAGKWYLYFSAGRTDDSWAIRIYVLDNSSANPLEGEWIERGQINTGWESFALDATTFEHRGRQYLAWCQFDPKLGKGTNIYLAPMANPTTLAGPAVMLSRPEFSWERVRYPVNEGPAFLAKKNRVFLTYSASGTGAEYCLGLLSAAADADLLDPKSWNKSPVPVFQTSEVHGIFGPGHNSFTTTPDGATDLLVYHARNYRDIVGDPLHDPNRHIRMQVIQWKADGSPDFGEPLAETKSTPAIDAPAAKP